MIDYLLIENKSKHIYEFTSEYDEMKLIMEQSINEITAYKDAYKSLDNLRGRQKEEPNEEPTET